MTTEPAVTPDRTALREALEKVLPPDQPLTSGHGVTFPGVLFLGTKSALIDSIIAALPTAPTADVLRDLRAEVEAKFPRLDWSGEHHTDDCSTIRFPGSTGPDPEPPDPCSCGVPDILAAIDARLATQPRPHVHVPVTRAGIPATNAWCRECGHFPLPLEGAQAEPTVVGIDLANGHDWTPGAVHANGETCDGQDCDNPGHYPPAQQEPSAPDGLSPLTCPHGNWWRDASDFTWCKDCGRWRDDIMREHGYPPSAPDELDGATLRRAWDLSGRPDPLGDDEAWDGFALTIAAVGRHPEEVDAERLAASQARIDRREATR